MNTIPTIPGESREEKLAKIQNRIAQLKKKFPKADEIGESSEASSAKSKPKSPPANSVETPMPSPPVVEEKSKEIEVKPKDAAPQVGENYDSDLDLDLGDEDVRKVVTKGKLLKTKVKDGKGFLYMFSDKQRYKVGQTRQPSARMTLQPIEFTLPVSKVLNIRIKHFKDFNQKVQSPIKSSWTQIKQKNNFRSK